MSYSVFSSLKKLDYQHFIRIGTNQDHLKVLIILQWSYFLPIASGVFDPYSFSESFAIMKCFFDDENFLHYSAELSVAIIHSSCIRTHKSGTEV